jgi:hypothetical protein
MPAAITVSVGTATEVGSCAIRTTKSATIFGSNVGSTAIDPSGCSTPCPIRSVIGVAAFPMSI